MNSRRCEKPIVACNNSEPMNKNINSSNHKSTLINQFIPSTRSGNDF